MEVWKEREGQGFVMVSNASVFSDGTMKVVGLPTFADMGECDARRGYRINDPLPIGRYVCDDPLPMPQMVMACWKWCCSPAMIVCAAKQLYTCCIRIRCHTKLILCIGIDASESSACDLSLSAHVHTGS